MALPVLNENQQNLGSQKPLRDQIRNLPAANDPDIREIRQSRVSKVVPLRRPAKEERAVKKDITRAPSNNTATLERVQNEKQRAEARLEQKPNPLVPLINKIGDQLSGIQKTLVEMQKTIQQVGKNIVDSIKALDLGVRR